MDSKKLFYTLSLLRSFCFSLVIVSSMSVFSFAEGLPDRGRLTDSEIVQDEQTEFTESASSSSDPEPMGDDQLPVEPEQHSEIIQDAQIEVFEPLDIEYLVPVPYTAEESESQLARIEYHLSLISGFVTLVVCGWFFWITVWRPLRSFIVF